MFATFGLTLGEGCRQLHRRCSQVSMNCLLFVYQHTDFDSTQERRDPAQTTGACLC